VYDREKEYITFGKDAFHVVKLRKMEQHKISELRINHCSEACDLQEARAEVLSKSTLDDVEACSACNKPFMVDELVVFY
jgi:hypothetical protein